MQYSLSVDLSQLEHVTAGIKLQVADRLSHAVVATAQAVEESWKSSVQQAKLWEGEKRPYIESITTSMLGPFEAEIVADYRLAHEIEVGRPRKDLKAVLPTARKARTVKSGKHAGQKYLIIPFRHNTPGHEAHARAMPDHIYAEAKGLSPSRVLPPGSKKPAQRKSATGHLVPQHSYSWGDRLPAGLAPKAKPHHKTDRYAGMTRFDTSSGGQKSSSYMTFRVMTEYSDGWIIQPRPGLYLAKGVADKLDPVFSEIVSRAVSLDAS